MQWMARGEVGLPAGPDWLTAVEAARAGSMRFTKRRTEYLLRRWAGKCAVASAIGLPDDPATLGRVAVLNRRTGAPYVQVDGEPLGLDISLTDRAGWAVCLVGPDLGAVGCDLEIVEPRSPGFVRDFLTPAEQQLVQDVSDRRRAGGPARGPGGDHSSGSAGDPARASAGQASGDLGADPADAMANLIWSAKESALKVMRVGLRADTRSVAVTVQDPSAVARPGAGWSRLSVAVSGGALAGWWRRDGVFLLTVVAGSLVDSPPQELPGSAPLSLAQPLHSWLAHPLVD